MSGHLRPVRAFLLVSSVSLGGALSLAGCSSGNTYQTSTGSTTYRHVAVCPSTPNDSGFAPVGAALDCSQLSVADSGVCPDGTLLLFGQTYDLCKTVQQDGQVRYPLGGVTLGASGCPNFTAQTDSAGNFDLCVPPGQNVTTVFSDDGYVSGNMAEVSLSQNLGYLGSRGGIFLVCDDLLNLYKTQSVGFDPTKGSVLILFLSLSQAGLCNDLSGWTVSANLPTGCPASYPVAYINGVGTPVQTPNGTYAEGYAIIYNVDTAQTLDITVGRASDAGISLDTCPLQNGSFGFTGRVVVTPGSFGYFPIGVP